MTEYFIVALDRETLEKVLCYYMSKASSKCLENDWYDNLEESLPHICRQLQRLGMGPSLAISTMSAWHKITIEDVIIMCHIADQLGYWVNKSAKPYYPHCDRKETK